MVGEHMGDEEGEDSRRVYFFWRVSRGWFRKKGMRGIERGKGVGEDGRFRGMFKGYWENFRLVMKDLEKLLKIAFMFVLNMVIEPRCCCYIASLEDE